MAGCFRRKAGLASRLALSCRELFQAGDRFRQVRYGSKHILPPHIGTHIGTIIFQIAFVCFVHASIMQPAAAGLTASEVVLVVNGRSLNSRTLANHYVKLRDIPSVNVVVLEDIPDREQITVHEFRERILVPLLKEIELRNISSHVQCIAYSADFPTAIDISQDLANLKDLNTVFTKVASINGLTFLYDMTLRADPAYITPEINFYARRTMGAYFTNPGGKESESLWSDANFHVISEEFDKAIESIDELVEKLPHQFPLKYLAAAYAAEAKKPQQAIQRLEEAISGGWNSGGYLAADSRFNVLRNSDEFQSLASLLEQDSGKWQPTVAFNARSAWAANGVEFPWDNKKNNVGLKYLLCTVLGVTRGVGNSLDEAIESLKRAKQADSTHPLGGFYFSSTTDVRTTTRKPNFALAVEELKKLGFDAEIIYQALPTNQPAVLGAQLGAPNFDWAGCSSKLVPGAIVENLTSLGGVMTSPNSQTPLTHLIAAGAAGSSGTVTEPYSVQFKFPTPLLYVHYAQGLSLAEAFYQSVTGPYQLLIVGDPLCQPFSIAPRQAVDSSPRAIKPNGVMQFQPSFSGLSYLEWLSLSQPPAKRRTQLRPSAIAVQIDGGTMQGGIVQPNVNVKLDGLSLGYHEVQVTVVGDDPYKQRSQQLVPVWIGERDLIRISLEDSGGKANSRSIADGPITLNVSAPTGSSEVAVYHHLEQLTSTQSTTTMSQVTLEPARLGMGPVRLQARAKLEDGSIVRSQPLWVEIVP